MYRAVFIDMDGTLLTKDHTISDWSKKVIQQLADKNILVVVVSARPLHGIAHLIKNVISSRMPVVSLNGSYIFFDEQIIFERSISIPTTEDIYNFLQPYDVTSMFYTQMEWFAIKEDERGQKEQKITGIKINILPFEKIKAYWQTNNTGPNKILIAGNENDMMLIEKKLVNTYNNQLNIYKSQPRYLEVMHKDASKTKAISFLLKRYGIDKSEAIAIGDNYNDKEMIVYAGVGVAMGNAPDDIKAIADYVTDTNNNDGVAKALTHFFEL